MIFLLICLILALMALYMVTRAKWKQVGPSLMDGYLLSVALYAIGALQTSFSTRFAHADDVVAMSLVALASALVGAIAFSAATKPLLAGLIFRPLSAAESASSPERPLIYAIGFVSALACIYFVYMLFTSPLLSQFLSIENIILYSTLRYARNAVASGSAGYMAPGFIKQFRDTLLPIVLYSVVILHPKPLRSIVFWAILLVTVAAMMINGQRSTVVVLMAGLGFSFYYVSQRNRTVASSSTRAGIQRLALAAVLVFAFWTLLSLALGRGSGKDASVFQIPLDAAWAFFDRISATLPRENIVTYMTWTQFGPTNGDSWLAAMGTIFKTNLVTDWNLAHLSNLLSFNMNGGDQGDSPLGLPPDVWLAWGWGGLLVVPAVYALMVGVIATLLLSQRSAMYFSMQIYLFLVMPVLVSPYSFILNGGAVCMALIGLVKIMDYFVARSRALKPPILPLQAG